MGKLSDDVLSFLLDTEAAKADEAKVRLRFRLLEPLLDLIEGRRELVRPGRVPSHVTMTAVTELWGFEEDVPFEVVPHAWSKMRESPGDERDYFLPFISLLLPDISTYEEGPHSEDWLTIFNFYQNHARDGLASLLQSRTQEIVSHFEAGLWEMMMRSYMLAVALVTTAIAYDDQEVLDHLGPVARFMAQVVPIGLTVDGPVMKLHVLCHD